MSDRDEMREGGNGWSEFPDQALDPADQTPDVPDPASDTEMEIQNPKSKIQNWKVWLIPLAGIIFAIVFGAFVRLMIGPTDRQEIDYGTQQFVPGESPHSTGPDSR